jgi:phosphate acyltransferase
MVKGNNSAPRSFKKAVIRGTRFIKKQSLKFNPKTENTTKRSNVDDPVVALDVMGGDYAPLEIIKGAVRAAAEYGIRVQLVGPPDRISRELSKHKIDGLPLEIVAANDVITMEDKNPASAVRRKSDSSIVVCMKQVLSGQANAVVSAGSTGAASAAAFLYLKRIPGIERPSICALIPTSQGEMVLLDAGANVDSTPVQIAQHALMGSLFASQLFNMEVPRVGLLNIGEEPGKGSQTTKEVFGLLSKMSMINFVGNVEGRTLSEHYCEVLVSDGFIGNIFLKTLEGAIKMSFQMLHQELTKSIDLKMGAMVCKPAFKALKQERLNPAKYGGAVLLGVQGVVVISHGNSNDFAILNAIKLAADTAKSRVVQKIKDSLDTPQAKEVLQAVHTDDESEE